MVRWGASMQVAYGVKRIRVSEKLAEVRRLVVQAAEARLHAARRGAVGRAANPPVMSRSAGARRTVHARYTFLMSLHLDGVASPEEQLELGRHLDACLACAAMWKQWQAVDRLLSTSPSVAPSRDFAEGLPQKLHSTALADRGGAG
jgi:hypothetical protein